MLRLAHEFGASTYVGVDRFATLHPIDLPGINFYFENTDMLKFISDQPDNSTNICVNGIDSIFLPRTTQVNREYINQLVSQIARVVGKDHIAFGKGSTDILDYLIDHGFKKHEIIESTFVYTSSQNSAVFEYPSCVYVELF